MSNAPATDSRCSDPAFAEAYPSACRYFSRLILKNERCQSLVSGSPEFKAFVISNGQEVAITSGVTFTSSRTTVATINASTGVASSVAAGKTTISALWNGQYAFALLEVVATCGAASYLVLLDNSFSMGQNFNGVYPTKLAYGKYLCERFFSSMNTTKDRMAFGNFNLEADVNVELTNVIADLNSYVPEVVSVRQRTDIRDAIIHGSEYLEENVTSGLKILVLITDGQSNHGLIPGPSARAFKESGGIIIVIGIRAFDAYFQLLNEISTKGFFISAHPSNTSETLPESYCLNSPLVAQTADPSPLQVISEF